MSTNWGIVGTGAVCNDFANALSMRSKEEQKVVAVSGRDLQKSQEFADKHQISKFYSDYEALALDDQVQVVYIGITTHCHYEATKVFLNAGKSVLCEKPLGMNVEQTEEMIALAQSKKSLFDGSHLESDLSSLSTIEKDSGPKDYWRGTAYGNDQWGIHQGSQLVRQGIRRWNSLGSRGRLYSIDFVGFWI